MSSFDVTTQGRQGGTLPTLKGWVTNDYRQFKQLISQKKNNKIKKVIGKYISKDFL